ncbi:MAG: AI-2E family transporter, partial [Clostridiales bacterium]|nr:AI-2E family transporter [Clostridiales bacterium]
RIFYGLREIARLFLPYGLRTGARRVVGDMHSVFSGYIRGQLTDALIMAVLISVLLSVIGVDFAIVIGIFTGFSNIIPYFGAIIGFLLSVIVALISGEPIKALYAAIGVLVLQQIDAVFINPKVVGKNVELSPLLVILALSAGGTLFGMPGMILAVPVCAIAKMFLTRYIEYRREQIINRKALNES